MLNGFARAAISRLENHDEIIDEREIFDRLPEDEAKPSFKKVLLSENEKRRKVLLACLPLITDPTDVVYLMWTETPLCPRSDFTWILDCCINPDLTHLRSYLDLLAERLFHPSIAEHLTALFDIQDKLPDIFQKFEHYLVVDLNSDHAKYLKARFEEDARYAEEEIETERRGEERQQNILNHIAEALKSMEASNANAWISFYRASLFDSRNESRSIIGRELDITDTVTWLEADPSVQANIVEGAKNFILEFEPSYREWLHVLYTEDKYFPAGYAGLAALYLILKTDAAFFSSLSPNILQGWAPIVIAYPTTFSDKDQTIANLLACMCYEYAPVEIITTLLQSIEVQNRKTGTLYRIDFLDACWDTRLASSLVDLLDQGVLTPSSTQIVLLLLMKHNVLEARLYAERLIAPPYADEESLQKGVVAASMLFQKTEDAGWNTVWLALQSDDIFAREVLAVITDFGSRNSQLGHQLSEDQLGELYTWLVRKYPPEQDPQHKGGYTPTPIDRITDWRKSIPVMLSMMGTQESVEILDSLVEQYSEIDSLVYARAASRENLRRQTWIPPQPRDIFTLT